MNVAIRFPRYLQHFAAAFLRKCCPRKTVKSRGGVGRNGAEKNKKILSNIFLNLYQKYIIQTCYYININYAVIKIYCKLKIAIISQ
jgi:hypothetical protein